MKKIKFVSIVVPTYNREKQIKICLDALLKQDYPSNRYEIIVINDGSKDNTEIILKNYSKRNKNFKYFSQKNSGPAIARNKGISLSTGEIIIFIDDDVVVKKDLIKRHIADYEDKNIGGVGGQVLPKLLSWADKYYLARYLDEIYTRMTISDPESGKGLATANCSYLNKILKKVKGFNETFPLAAGEDIELSKRVMLEGYKLLKDPEMISEHLRSETISSTIRLKFKRMSSVVVEEKIGTLAKNVGNPYNPRRVILQWKNFIKLKKEILKEKIKISDFFKFFYLTIMLAMASVAGKVYFKYKIENKR